MSTIRLGRRMLSEQEYQEQRRKGIGTNASVFRLGERVTGIPPKSKPVGVATYATAAIEAEDKDQPPARMPKDTGTAAPAAASTPEPPAPAVQTKEEFEEAEEMAEETAAIKKRAGKRSEKADEPQRGTKRKGRS